MSRRALALTAYSLGAWTPIALAVVASRISQRLADRRRAAA